MLKLSCNIIIKGNKTVKIKYVNSVEIVTMIDNFTDTARIVVPRKLQFEGKSINDFISRNNSIEIHLGYDDDLRLVFNGYVKSVSTGSPTIIECENESWTLKQIQVLVEHYPKFSLQKYIKKYMPNFDCEIEDVDLGEVRISEKTNIAKVLEYIMHNYPINFFFRGGVFYGGMPYTMIKKRGDVKTIKFDNNINIISSNLNYVLAEDVNIQIVAKVILKDNKKIEWKEPQLAEKAEIRTFLVPKAENTADLKDYALKMLKKFKIDKMDGEFTAFGIPFIRKGDIANLFDSKNIERDKKKFLVKGVTYKFGVDSGYRQIVILGQEIRETNE